jgi:hypothetical protein
MRWFIYVALASALLGIGCDQRDGAASSGGSGGASGSAKTGSIASSSDQTSSAATGQADCTPDRCSAFVGSIVDVTYGPGAGFGQDELPCVVMGPPHGGGDLEGSLDVLSLGNGGSITLAFGAQTIVDGPGADFIVFENPFYPGGDASAVFAELATVSVSDDGVTWKSFPCTALDAPFGSCAGWHPVEANPDNGIDPTDPSVAGGDAFDLADVGLSTARFVRITDRVDQVGFAGAFDLDAVALVHATCKSP